MKLDCGVPLVTTISSPSCVHSSFVNFPGVNLSFNNSVTRSGTVVLLPLLRTVVSRSTSFVKSPYVCYKSPVLIYGVLREQTTNFKLQMHTRIAEIL